MKQMTVAKLYAQLSKLMQEGYGDKKIIIADDTEGNGYHGMYFSVTTDSKAIKEAIECSNGLYETDTEDPNDLVILG